MIERLEDLTIGQFIDMVCGDTSVLGADQTEAERMAFVARNIVLEYKDIADPAGVKTYLSEHENYLKVRIAVTLFNICHNLMALRQYGKVREIMADIDEPAEGRSDEWLKMKVSSEFERAKLNLAKIEDEKRVEDSDATDIRRDFDEQTAALMAYFKFQIDTSTIKANIYAHLVARHNREIKAQLAAMKKFHNE